MDNREDPVDVAEEVFESGVAPGEVVIRKPVTSLPALPTFSLDRKTQAPVIPAGIAQATQPQFVQKLFQVRHSAGRTVCGHLTCSSERQGGSRLSVRHQQQDLPIPPGTVIGGATALNSERYQVTITIVFTFQVTTNNNNMLS